MSSIDERIVSLKFDNKQFEEGIKQSLASLEELKRGLNVSESTRNLNDLNTAGKNFSLKGIADGVDTIANKFSALGIVGITVLANLATAAYNFAQQLVTSVTIDPIMAGFSKYESKINSMQTILNSTSNTVGRASQATLQGINAAADAATQSALASSANSIKGLAKVQESASLALNKAIAAETKAFDKQHQDKLDLYNEEYLAKLKIIDEERYNKIKAIDDEINAIIGLTTDEQEATKKAAEEKKLQTLKNNVLSARGIRNTAQATQALADYQAELDRDKLLNDRQASIDGLETSKAVIETEYDAKTTALQDEFSLRTEQENKIFTLSSENLKEEQDQRLRNLRDYQRTQSEYAQGSSSRALAYIEQQKNAQIQAANEVASKINTSLSMDQVNAQVERLNWFSDETSYSFTEMLSNVGKFTAAGVELEPAVTALQGVATWAALSGVNAQVASTSMYQLSQAVGSGAVVLNDWMSIEKMNMATKEFKDTAIETAKSLGTLSKSGEILTGTEKGLIVTSDNFRNTLSSKWFTSDVLIKTLNEYGEYADAVYKVAKDQGLSAAEAMKTAEIVALGSTMRLGEKAFKAAQQSKTFTDALNATKDAVSTGWAKSFEILFGNLDEAKVLWTDVASAMWEVFASGKEARNSLLQGWKDLGGRDALIEAISTAYQGLADVIRIVQEAFSEIFPPMTAQNLFNLTDGLRNFTKQLKMGEEFGTNFKKTFKGLFAIMDIGKMAFSAIRDGTIELIKYLLPMSDGLINVTGSIGDFFVRLRDAIKTSDVFNIAVQSIVKILQPLGIFLREAATAIGIFFSNISGSLPPFNGFVQTIADLFSSFNTFDTQGASEVATKLQDSFTPLASLGPKLKESFDGLGTALDTSLGKLKTTTSKIGSWFKKLSDILGGSMKGITIDKVIGTLTGGALVMLLIGLKNFVTTITKLFKPGNIFVKGIVGVLDATSGALKAWGQSIKADVILKIAIAVGILALALIALSLVDPEKLGRALFAITVLFGELAGTLAVFTKIAKSEGFKDMGKVTRSLVFLSIAVLILASAVAKLAKLSWEDMSKGLLGVGALLAALAISTKFLMAGGKGDITTTGKDLIGVGIGMFIFAAAISKLADVVIKLGALDIGNMIKGLFILGVLMFELTAFMRLGDLSKIDASTGVGFLMIALGINVITSAVDKLSKIEPNALKKGLIALLGILAGLSLFMMQLESQKNFLNTAGGVLVLSVALLTLVSVIGMLGSMDIKTLTIGLATISMLLVVFAATMSSMDKAAKGAPAMVIMALALMMLVPVILALGSMDLKTLAVGLLAISAVIGIFAVAALIFQNHALVTGLYGLATAIAAFGLGMALAGVGILAFSMGLASLVAIGTTGSAALKIVFETLAAMIPTMLKAFAVGFIDFIKMIADNADPLAEAIGTILLAMLDMVDRVVPRIIDSFSSMLVQLWEHLAAAVPVIVVYAMRLIIGFVRGIADNIYQIIDAGADLIINFLKGIQDNSKEVINQAFLTFISFIDGLANAVRNNGPTIWNSAVNLVDAILSAIADVIGLGKIYAQGKDMLDKIIAGFKDGWNKMWQAAYDIGGNIIEGMIAGIKGTVDWLIKTASGAAKGAVEAIAKFLNIASPSKVTTKIGEYFGMGLANGIQNLSGDIAKTAKGVAAKAVDALSMVPDVLVGLDDTFSPVITPVIDLTNVKTGEKMIKSLLSTNQNIGVDTAYNGATAITQNMKLSEQAIDPVQHAIDSLKGVFKGTLDEIKLAVPQVNFNGTYTFAGQEDIDYFMNQAALLVKRRK